MAAGAAAAGLASILVLHSTGRFLTGTALYWLCSTGQWARLALLCTLGAASVSLVTREPLTRRRLAAMFAVLTAIQLCAVWPAITQDFSYDDLHLLRRYSSAELLSALSGIGIATASKCSRIVR